MYIILLFLAALGVFWGVVCIVKLYTGCDDSSAIAKIRDFVNGIPHVPLEQDPGLWTEIWTAIRNIIGDARFDKLSRIYAAIASSLEDIRLYGHHSGLPYIIIIIDLVDDAERQLIEAVVVGIVNRHLRRRGLPDTVIVTWERLFNYGLEYLEIRFGETREQRAIVRTVLADELRQLNVTHEPLTDDADSDIGL